ncbi:MAG TPA: hypothetical protein VH020_09550 [Stellaceae bacterium]|jgi:hypothetical protein|nr:hypothetical protein [Stellaceae bacterium]
MGFGGECLRLKLVGELPEFIGIDPWPETEGMRDRPRRGMASARRDFAQAGADRTIHGFLERHPEFPRAPLQQARQIVLEGQGRSHGDIFDAAFSDVKASNMDARPATTVR